MKMQCQQNGTMRRTYGSSNLYCEFFSWSECLACWRIGNCYGLRKRENGKDEKEDDAEKLHVVYVSVWAATWVH